MDGPDAADAAGVFGSEVVIPNYCRAVNEQVGCIPNLNLVEDVQYAVYQHDDVAARSKLFCSSHVAIDDDSRIDALNVNVIEAYDEVTVDMNLVGFGVWIAKGLEGSVTRDHHAVRVEVDV